MHEAKFHAMKFSTCGIMEKWSIVNEFQSTWEFRFGVRDAPAVPGGLLSTGL